MGAAHPLLQMHLASKCKAFIALLRNAQYLMSYNNNPMLNFTTLQ